MQHFPFLFLVFFFHFFVFCFKAAAWHDVTMTESLQTLNHCPFLEWLVMERNL